MAEYAASFEGFTGILLFIVFRLFLLPVSPDILNSFCFKPRILSGTGANFACAFPHPAMAKAILSHVCRFLRHIYTQFSAFGALFNGIPPISSFVRRIYNCLFLHKPGKKFIFCKANTSIFSFSTVEAAFLPKAGLGFKHTPFSPGRLKPQQPFLPAC